ncbi:SDR family oxidoreductase [Lederbergia wuyishanensis]|uniref:NAD(P)-dependent dehydrogenase (Short-subunit alcohol dehydrogenase family) n=1 Tax=Lederbergia wuyishanensis TaxID=1347903 RepID=A0ABU0CYW3_9BACI|nr:SDR family oxidoreductase [Lederbergia wuyishanensis]MCJ8005982.1 SDR family oxidoreductase [Lederbergia wuyishanensis]MDQ0341347.1 NAD(P)-dependent dehydrogenase (short-subunit alcohol dehydrogenase family) [Lederbergia wuyishanensis]
MNNEKQTMPKQKQVQQPGLETLMNPEPESIKPSYKGSGKLEGKVAIVTGGDSGIGKSVVLHFAKEGADIVICYLEEEQDAENTKALVEKEGRKCKLIRGDVGQEQHCIHVIQQVMEEFGKIDILVNNAAEQHPQKSLLDITESQLEKTFRTNIYAYFFLTKAALPHLKAGSSIINTASITAYAGSPELLDYSATKGAIVSFTRSLSKSLAAQRIRVNGVAPGPIWTPLIPATFDAEKVSKFGGTQPLGRPGQPSELGPGYVYLASDDSSYVTGQMLHINGGEVING